MLDFVIFAFTAVFGLIVFLIWLLRRVPKPDKVEGEKVPRWEKEPADPKLGDMGELANHGSLHEYLLHLHDNGRCPVTSFWWSPDLHVVSLCSPQAFKDTVKLTDRPPILFKGFEPLIGSSSIQYANGSDWEERRKCLYSTLKGEDLESYFPHFVQIAQETEARWSSCENQKISLSKETFHMTIKGICRSCFGDVFESDEKVNAYAELYHICWREQEIRIKEGDPEPGSQREVDFQRSLQLMKDTIRRIIKARRDSEDLDEVPFIDALLQSGVPEEQIVADAISFMVGGFHTSGNFMAWMFWNLVAHPEVQERLRAEVQELVGVECGDRLKSYALNGDTYLRQVEDETLRWCTLGPWAARFSDKDMQVAGYKVPALTPMIHALGVSLYNETQWKDVDKFDPDRFAKGSPHARRGLEFCPFGTPSRRKCPGYQFSYFEVSIFTAILLNRFTLEPVEGQKVEKFHGLVTEPKEDIYIYIRPREDK